ncbi:MAG TPA: 3-dehydroquinate synthase [Gemmatimonadaceae bacterium]|nr:3-dehydroquinate synthase [Gemmatimonadaceae bacterium]
MVAAEGSASAPERSVELLGYRVRVAPWLLEQVGRVVAEVAPAHTVAVITDDHVAPLHLPAVVGSLRHFLPHTRTIVRAIPSGEQQKTRETWAALTDWMTDERCGRDTTVVALGGGVVGDLAGFVAATFMRGIPVVQCPTSLLAMVDASVGGKVGVDTPAGKNLVGAFHQPHAVLVDPTALQTLPPDHRRAGLAEVIKHGAIADAGYLDEAVALGATLVSGDDVAWHGERLTALIARSIAIKADVVRQDEREGGVRQVLNFGHTIGHAIEAASGFTLLHGEAIAIGMTCEALLAERLGIAEPGTGDVIERALRAVGLPTQCPPGMPPSTLIDLMRIDKKSRNSRIVFALPARIGTMARVDRRFGIAVGDDVVLAALSSTR